MDGLNFFHPAQVWRYNTRIGEEASTLTVLKIDELDDDAIIHIRIDRIGADNSNYIKHLPFSSEAIEASVTSFVLHLDALPDFEEGYQQWKQAFDAGRAGFWKMPVREALDLIDTVMNNQK